MSTAPECSTIPAVVVEGYVEKGAWLELAGLKVYATGSPASSKAVVTIYDIFGPAPQTLQGADLMAAALSSLVIVPDLLNGYYMKSEWMQVSNEENDKAKAEFMKHAATLEAHSKKMLEVIQEGKEKWGSVKSWAALGLCWGGKVRFSALSYEIAINIIPGCCAELSRRNSIQGHGSSSPWVSFQFINSEVSP
jgi:dienelactone hydrolase